MRKKSSAVLAKHSSIAADIAKKITAGKFPVGKPLPPLRELSKQYGAAVMTVHQAVKDLIADGIVQSDPHHRPVASLGRSITSIFDDAIGIVLSRDVGDMCDDPTWRGAIFRGAMDAIRRTPSSIVILQTAKWRQDFPAGLSHLPLQGLMLLACPFQPSIFKQYKFFGTRFPVVSIDTYSEHVHSVIMDNDAATRKATEHLIGLGHRRIAFIRPLVISKNARGIDPDAQQRADAFNDTCMEAGLAPDQYAVFSAPFQTPLASIREAVRAKPRYTAVVTLNNFHAQQIFNEGRLAGLSVPRDLSIVSFSTAAATQWTGPTANFEEFGARAVELIRARPVSHQVVRIQAGWNQGETTAPLKG